MKYKLLSILYPFFLPVPPFSDSCVLFNIISRDSIMLKQHKMSGSYGSCKQRPPAATANNKTSEQQLTYHGSRRGITSSRGRRLATGTVPRHIHTQESARFTVFNCPLTRCNTAVTRLPGPPSESSTHTTGIYNTIAKYVIVEYDAILKHQ